MAVTRSAIKRGKAGGSSGHQQHLDAPHTKAQAYSHWRELHDPTTGLLLACRPPGAPAGVFPHTPWWHCCLHDPYERVNFWSHWLPGIALLVLAALASAGLAPGGRALVAFCLCAAATHLCSALTHVWPDSHSLEKADHLGIVATIVGTPLTALMALEHGHVPTPMLWVTAGLMLAAFLPPAPRVAGFIGGGCVTALLYWRQLASWPLAVEIALYLAGAAAFLRNDGHQRWPGFSDHHLLHYFVTVATTIHVAYLVRAAGSTGGA